MESLSCSVVILPPEQIVDRAIELSTQLSGVFTLNHENKLPHITMYMCELPVANIEKARAAVRAVLQDATAVSLNFTGYSVSMSYAFADFEPTQELFALQAKLIEAVNPLREGLIRSTDAARIDTLTPAEQEGIRQSGYRMAGGNYEPHMSLTKLVGDESVMQQLPQDLDLSFAANTLAFVFTGENGTCREVIERYELK